MGRLLAIRPLRHHEIVPGIDEGTVMILAERTELSAEETRAMIERAYAFGSEQGIQLGRVAS